MEQNTSRQNNTMRNYMENKQIELIKNKGYIDKEKYKENIRILLINVNGLSL